MNIEVYCDGSIYPNPGGPIGWGFIAVDIDTGEILKEHSEGRAATPGQSNNSAEIAALIRSLIWLQGRPAKIFSDSQYTVNGANQWAEDWARKGFKRMRRGVMEPVPNASLWAAVLKNHRPGQIIEWVRGHNGHKFNERADKLALQGRLSVTPKTEKV